MLSRRGLIKAGAAGTAALVVLPATTWAEPSKSASAPAFTLHTLTEQDRSLLTALVPAILADALPTNPAEAAQAIMEVIIGMDMGIALLPALSQAQIRQLLDTLENQLLPNWSDPALVAAFVAQTQADGNRPPNAQALQIGMDGLIDLAQSAWYGNPRSWARTGYAGPPQLY